MKDKLALSVKDVAAMTPRGVTSVREACQAGLLKAAQNGERRFANWVITPKAVEDWVRRGCPIPQYSHSKKSA
ncbi:helix-turn-helix domain-containing protein [Williamsia sp.]|uniref:helix-turn-helix domain-containing protein n=1 Tax=Williamsia sp. TaxID=1872085 RepID=UPI002F9432C3